MEDGYRIALIGRRLPPLDYRSAQALEPGQLVIVPLQKRLVRGVILKKVDAQGLSLRSIESIESFVFSDKQLQVAHFIASYYHVTIGEALALFFPFCKDRMGYTPLAADIPCDGPTLSGAQAEALQAIQSYLNALLFAPTGSGKTEIYITLFKQILQLQKRAIFLMPEISLTPQMQKRLEYYFGDHVAIWHSRLSKKRRQETLRRICNGEVWIVAGPRSTLFLPITNLGLIVVDEEHDDSYKSHRRPRYHARDVALFMGKMMGIQVLLGSATPNAVTFDKCPIVRIKKPFIETKKQFLFEKGGCSLTPTMLDAIEHHTRDGGQALIFLPTRANFKYLYCEQCGYKVTCPFCSVGMSLHRSRRIVRCHYCGYVEKIPNACPQCGDLLRADRMGTAEVVETLQAYFPHLRLQQFDKDTITTPRKLQKALERFAAKETDVLVGTQMLAKGHDYPDITLSIILGLDYVVALPDYRARERAMQLFVQIAGRAGRSREAQIIVQTNEPAFFSRYLGDYERFIQEELAMRQPLYPPFQYLCRLLFSAKEEAQGWQKMRTVQERLGMYEEYVEIVGADKAAIEKIAGKFRFAILLRSHKRTYLLRVLKAIDDGSFEIDMDPVDFS